MTDIKALWKNQNTEHHEVMSIVDLNAHLQKLRSRTRLRNWLLYTYSVLNALSIVIFIFSDIFPRQKAPALLMLVAHLFVLWQVWYRFGRREKPQQSSAQNVLEYLREELQHQHRAVAKAWLWYIAPFMPPFIWQLTVWLLHINFSTQAGAASFRIFLMVVFSAALFWSVVWWLFARHATQLELELDRVNGLRTE